MVYVKQEEAPSFLTTCLVVVEFIEKKENRREKSHGQQIRVSLDETSGINHRREKLRLKIQTVVK